MPIFSFGSRGASRATLTEEVEVKCDSCSKTFFVSAEHFNFDTVGENEIAGDLDFSCPNCSRNIQIWFRSIHTNEGSKYKDIGLSGAELIKGFGEGELTLGKEIYALDESLLYLPEQKEIVTHLHESITDLINAITKDPKILYKIGPRDFEELLAGIFAKHGFQVELTKKTRDGGRDLIAIRSDLGIKSKYIIECKRYAVHRPVSVDLVRALYGVQMQEGANKSVLATTSFFTADAKKFAKKTATTEWAMDLKDYNDVVSWIASAKKG